MNTRASLCHHLLNLKVWIHMLKLHLFAADYRRSQIGGGLESRAPPPISTLDSTEVALPVSIEWQGLVFCYLCKKNED